MSFVCACKEADGKRFRHRMREYLEMGQMWWEVEIEECEDRMSPRIRAWRSMGWLWETRKWRGGLMVQYILLKWRFSSNRIFDGKDISSRDFCAYLSTFMAYANLKFSFSSPNFSPNSQSVRTFLLWYCYRKCNVSIHRSYSSQTKRRTKARMELVVFTTYTSSATYYHYRKEANYCSNHYSDVRQISALILRFASNQHLQRLAEVKMVASIILCAYCNTFAYRNCYIPFRRLSSGRPPLASLKVERALQAVRIPTFRKQYLLMKN